METTDMAVVVSQGQNEVAELERTGLDIRPHRARMLAEQLDERFKDSRDPMRLVFVCAMWMTDFDAPSCSTVYLDRPMRNHTLMQTTARANRVFPDKENGLIVDYIGVFRDLEKALAIYGAATGDDRIGSPIQDTSRSAPSPASGSRGSGPTIPPTPRSPSRADGTHTHPGPLSPRTRTEPPPFVRWGCCATSSAGARRGVGRPDRRGVTVLRRPKPEPARPLLDGSTMVVCVEPFRPGGIARMLERGEWVRLDSPAVKAFPERFALRVSDPERESGQAA